MRSEVADVTGNVKYIGGWGRGSSPHIFVSPYSDMVRHFPTKHSCDVYPQLHKAFQGLRI